MWAEPLGNNVYQIENVPFFSYGLNFKDTVEAFPDSDGILEISRVIDRSGNKTIRAIFRDHIAKGQQEEYIENIMKLDCSLERWNEFMLAINIRSTGNFREVFDHLDLLSENSVLDFETCHERVEGSFDDEPDND